VCSRKYWTPRLVDLPGWQFHHNGFMCDTRHIRGNPRRAVNGAGQPTVNQQLARILTAVDTDLDLVVLVGDRCGAQVARAGVGYDRLGVVVPFSRGAELRLVMAGQILLRLGGRDLLERVVDKIVVENFGDRRRRQILRRVWVLNEVSNPAKRAS
jgi:hypothetical protein